MAKAKKSVFILNRKDWNRVRKMDHCQMTLWAESIYKSGFRDGNEKTEDFISRWKQKEEPKNDFDVWTFD